MNQFGGHRDDWTILPKKMVGETQYNSYSPPDHLYHLNIFPSLSNTKWRNIRFKLVELINPQKQDRYHIEIGYLTERSIEEEEEDYAPDVHYDWFCSIPVTELDFNSVKSIFHESTKIKWYFIDGDMSLVSDKIMTDISYYLNLLWDDFSNIPLLKFPPVII